MTNFASIDFSTFDANKLCIQVPVRKPLPKPRHYPPLCVREFRVVVDSSLVGLGYQLRICGADVRILEDDAPHTETVQVSVCIQLVWSVYLRRVSSP